MPAQQPRRHVPEQEHARQPAERGKQPERPFRKAKQSDGRQLDPEEEERADLGIVQRPKQIEIASIQEIDGEERLVVPDRIDDQITDQPHQQARARRMPRSLAKPRSAPRSARLPASSESAGLGIAAVNAIRSDLPPGQHGEPL